MHATGDCKRIAVYGGSFNPPHICHQLILLYVLETQLIDEIVLVPCYRHAFEKGQTLAPYEFRRRWCEALIAPFGSRCSISDVEREMGGESRTIDTMKEFERRNPKARFSLVLGSDIRSERKKWKNFEDLEKNYPIIWIGRQEHDWEPGDPLVLPDISSRRLRKALSEGKSVEGLIPTRVLASIRESEWSWKKDPVKSA